MRQQLFCDLCPAYARRVPPPDVCALLKPGCASRNHESLVAPDVGREFVAAMAEHDKVRARKGPLETVPILFVAQRGRHEPVGASDPVVVRDDGIAIDLDRAALRFHWGERAHDRDPVRSSIRQLASSTGPVGARGLEACSSAGGSDYDTTPGSVCPPGLRARSRIAICLPYTGG